MSSKPDPAQCGKLGSKYGKRGGRPSTKDQPGMTEQEYNEILEFLNSKQSIPIYPARMRGASSRSKSKKKKRKYSRNCNKRKEFRTKCEKFTVKERIKKTSTKIPPRNADPQQSGNPFTF